MTIELINISEDNRQQCIDLKVASGQIQYIASNADSLETETKNRAVARPYAIYCDGNMVEKWKK